MLARLLVVVTRGAPTDARLVRAEHIARIAAYVIVGYFALLVLGLAVLLLFCGAILVVMRLNGPESPFSRRVTARLVARTAPGSTHRADQRGEPVALAKGIEVIRARDPLFDEQIVLQAARRALFFLFVAAQDGNDRRLRQVSTERFWKSPAGRDAERQAELHASRASSIRSLGPAPEATMLKGLTPMVLDYDAPEVELWAVKPEVGGADRITVRVAYRGESALAGPGASLRAATMTGRFSLSAARTRQAQVSRTPAALPPVDSARIGTQGWYDFEFTRATAAHTSPGDGNPERRCTGCGAPYRSDLDVACRNCKAERSTPQGGWKLDYSWLVVDTEAHAGHGINRSSHDATWALRGAGKIALKLMQ